MHVQLHPLLRRGVHLLHLGHGSQRIGPQHILTGVVVVLVHTADHHSLGTLNIIDHRVHHFIAVKHLHRHGRCVIADIKGKNLVAAALGLPSLAAQHIPPYGNVAVVGLDLIHGLRQFPNGLAKEAMHRVAVERQTALHRPVLHLRFRFFFLLFLGLLLLCHRRAHRRFYIIGLGFYKFYSQFQIEQLMNFLSQQLVRALGQQHFPAPVLQVDMQGVAVHRSLGVLKEAVNLRMVPPNVGN